MAFRAFVAVDVGGTLPGVREALGELAALPADLKVVSASNLHVTLAFLGDIDEARVPAIQGVIAQACAQEPPFRMRVVGLGAFPTRGAPRVVWAGLQGADPLVRIADRLAHGLEALGFAREERGFSPHLTLARSRTPRGADAVRGWIEAGGEREMGEAAVAEVRLYESQLAPAGPKYRAVASVPLGGSA